MRLLGKGQTEVRILHSHAILIWVGVWPYASRPDILRQSEAVRCLHDEAALSCHQARRLSCSGNESVTSRSP